MAKEINIVVLGAGQIGQAVVKLCHKLQWLLNPDNRNSIEQQFDGSGNLINTVEFPKFVFNIHSWDIDFDKTYGANRKAVDFETIDVMKLAGIIKDVGANFVFNALPFNLNEKVATAAANADASYFDFTEDDVMADKVQNIYRAYPHLYCAVKCGLAPGFINYIGHSLAKKIDKADHLMISVGALPRNVNWSNARDNYNLSWSVDGLVNEYIRPCRVRINGEAKDIPALTGVENVMADGVQYEAAFTSGGVGSLLRELRIPNIAYKTLRYPGHYAYVREVCNRHHGEFEPIKQEFLKAFPFNKDDVIAVYAECKGKMNDGTYRRETYAAHFGGTDGLSAIQTTTAGGGVAVLEMILKEKLPRGIINHADISLDAFTNTETFATAFKKQ